jgi:hypothetical protein
MNHACEPNVQWESWGDIMVMRAGKRIASGDQLTFRYHDEAPKSPRVRGFICKCPTCVRRASSPENPIRWRILKELKQVRREMHQMQAAWQREHAALGLGPSKMEPFLEKSHPLVLRCQELAAQAATLDLTAFEAYLSKAELSSLLLLSKQRKEGTEVYDELIRLVREDGVRPIILLQLLRQRAGLAETREETRRFILEAVDVARSAFGLVSHDFIVTGLFGYELVRVPKAG